MQKNVYFSQYKYLYLGLSSLFTMTRFILDEPNQFSRKMLVTINDMSQGGAM